jgi:NADH dehydrogenase
MKPFTYVDKGTMATIGRNRAVVDVHKFHFQGFFAWFVWMFVHLVSLVGFRNKIVVLINWMYNYFTYDRALRLIITASSEKEKELEELIN